MNNYTIIITLVLSIIGWVVVHILSSKRDIRKERREFCRNTISFIEDLEKAALKYHMAESRNMDLEQDIKINISFLDDRLSLIEKYFPSYCGKVQFLRSAITLDNFQSAKFLTQSANSLIILSIRQSSHALKMSIYNIL